MRDERGKIKYEKEKRITDEKQRYKREFNVLWKIDNQKGI